jgi:hypothetical protein
MSRRATRVSTWHLALLIIHVDLFFSAHLCLLDKPIQLPVKHGHLVPAPDLWCFSALSHASAGSGVAQPEDLSRRHLLWSCIWVCVQQDQHTSLRLSLVSHPSSEYPLMYTYSCCSFCCHFEHGHTHTTSLSWKEHLGRGIAASALRGLVYTTCVADPII